MNTIKCNNRLCGKEYNVKFDNCPFCGTSNPLEESDRKKVIDRDERDKDTKIVNNSSQFNGFVVAIIWISIVFFGIRGVIASFTNILFSPAIGCLTLGLSIIGIVSLIYVLKAKKWALFMWIAYRLAAGIVNGFISSKFDFATNIIIAIANIVLMVLILQIKKNGVSAWSIIFKKHESHAVKESINPTLDEGIIGENTFRTNLVNNQKNETQNDSAVCDSIQNNDGTIDLEESHTIKNSDGNQEGVIPATETESHSKKFDNQDEKTIIRNPNEEEYRQGQKRKGNPKKWTWCVIGLIIAELVAGIWVIAKSNVDNSMTKQMNFSSNQTKGEAQDSQFANQQNVLFEYDNFGVSFDYPDDYILEEKVLEEGCYFKVYLDKENDTMFQSVQIEWRNNPQKYDPIAGRKVNKDALRNNYGDDARILRDYETMLGEEKVYWTDYVIEQYGGQLFCKSGITRIDDYVFVIQKISNIDIDNEEANNIFNSIRLTKK